MFVLYIGIIVIRVSLLVESGVRKSTWLPSISNVFINAAFIVNLRMLDVDCHVNHQYDGCFLNAYDIILISSLVIGLHQMLVNCLFGY